MNECYTCSVMFYKEFNEAEKENNKVKGLEGRYKNKEIHNFIEKPEKNSHIILYKKIYRVNRVYLIPLEFVINGKGDTVIDSPSYHVLLEEIGTADVIDE